MRFYQLFIDGKPFAGTELSNGGYNSGALHIEFDIPIASATTSLPGGWIKIHNPTRQDLFGSHSLLDKKCELMIGMRKGLPLSNPEQRGVGVIGSIWNPHANWQGTDSKIEFEVYGWVTEDYRLNAKKGQKLSEAVRVALEVSGKSVSIGSIKHDPVFDADYSSPNDIGGINNFAKHVNTLSQKMVGAKGYGGLQITVHQDQSIAVWDSIKVGAPVKEIVFNDFIGQPTAVRPYVIQLKLCMRADLYITQMITIATGHEILNRVKRASLNALQKDDVAGAGDVYQIIAVRHIGSYRNPSADSWITLVDAVQMAANGEFYAPVNN